MNLNAVWKHRIYELDFEGKQLICRKCGHKVSIPDFIASLKAVLKDKIEIPTELYGRFDDGKKFRLFPTQICV